MGCRGSSSLRVSAPLASGSACRSDPCRSPNKGQQLGHSPKHHSGQITTRHLNEDRVSGHRSATAPDTSGAWAAALVFTFNTVKASKSRDLLESRQKYSQAALFDQHAVNQVQAGLCPQRGELAFFLQQTAPYLPSAHTRHCFPIISPLPSFFLLLVPPSLFWDAVVKWARPKPTKCCRMFY